MKMRPINELRIETHGHSISGHYTEQEPGAEDTSTEEDDCYYDDDDDDDDDYDDYDDYDESSLRVSFSPSNAFLLQAMEGASARAKADIQIATKMAIREINSAISKSYTAEVIIEADKETAEARDRRTVGFGFVVVLFLFVFVFGLGENPLVRSTLSSVVGIDGFQIPMVLRNNIVAPTREMPDATDLANLIIVI